MTRTILGLATLLICFATPAHATEEATPVLISAPIIEAGDLIRGETYASVYYYAEDGLRYIFPNEKTYFTWYDNFDDVKWISDSEIADIQIGGNVTYKPGERLIKITSDPTVYAIDEHATLRPIATEEIAKELYGENWTSIVDDVPDELFGNYIIGNTIEETSQYSPDASIADAYSVSTDKNLSEYTLITISEEGYSQPTTSITSGTVIRWLNTDTENRSVTEWDRIWGSGTMETNEHFSKKFTQTGTWHYYSTYGDRNLFEGSIIVE